MKLFRFIRWLRWRILGKPTTGIRMPYGTVVVIYGHWTSTDEYCVVSTRIEKELNRKAEPWPNA